MTKKFNSIHDANAAIGGMGKGEVIEVRGLHYRVVSSFGGRAFRSCAPIYDAPPTRGDDQFKRTATGFARDGAR